MYYGVDFSGAEDAGRRIWLATAAAEGGKLIVSALCRAADLPNGGVERGRAITALGDFIAQAPARALFGLDFPFGLPLALVNTATWADFALRFGDDYPTAEIFPVYCRDISNGRELKRLTDSEAQTPFCAYNLRMYRQTYYGIRDLLAPLVQEELVSVLPMTRAAERPWLIEVCPASTLKRLGLYRPYKGKGAAQEASRVAILAALPDVQLPDALRAQVIADAGGDALDSVLCAYTAYRVAAIPRNLFLYAQNDMEYQLEGYVYVPPP